MRSEFSRGDLTKYRGYFMGVQTDNVDVFKQKTFTVHDIIGCNLPVRHKFAMLNVLCLWTIKEKGKLAYMLALALLPYVRKERPDDDRCRYATQVMHTHMKGESKETDLVKIKRDLFDHKLSHAEWAIAYALDCVADWQYVTERNNDIGYAVSNATFVMPFTDIEDLLTEFINSIA